jgi:hypothetical protein
MTEPWSGAACPADVLEAIPWYPDGLTAAQRGALEAHAAECADCRRELAFVQGARGEEPLVMPQAERVWARVLERIAAEDERRPVSQAAPPLRAGGALRGWGRPLRLAASLVLAVGLGSLATLAGLRLAGGEEPVYRTATALPEVSAAGPALDVVFRKDASAGEIETKLRAIGGSVVAGPSALGVYRIALRPGADAASAAAALRAEAGGVASLAEPVHP